MAETLTVRQERWLIGLLFVIMLVKGALWSLAFPLWQGPDEDDHYAVIQFIGENGRLPDEADVWLPDEVALSRELADVGRLDYNPEQRQGWSSQPVGLAAHQPHQHRDPGYRQADARHAALLPAGGRSLPAGGL